jgi:hypothetical protein
LGITNATQYESPLRRKSYGLDILHRVADSALESICIPAGDVIHLKDASGPWHNGPLAKRCRVEVEVEKPKGAVVSYEKRWFDADGTQTGVSCFWGPPMRGGDSQLEAGLEIWYRCTARQEWFAVPRGYEALEEGVERDPFAM